MTEGWREQIIVDEEEKKKKEKLKKTERERERGRERERERERDREEWRVGGMAKSIKEERGYQGRRTEQKKNSVGKRKVLLGERMKRIVRTMDEKRGSREKR